MNFVNIIPIPRDGGLDWPQTAVVSNMLRQDEIVRYDNKRRLYINIHNFRGLQTWNSLDVSNYVPLPNTHKFTSVKSLRTTMSRCRSAMVKLIRIHNERAGAHNRALQVQQQNDHDEKTREEEEEAAEKAEWTSTIVAVKAKLAMDAEEEYQSQIDYRMKLWERK